MYFDRDWEAGGEAFRRALEIDPNNAMARHGYADYLMALGRLDESVEQVKLGRRSNPLSPMANAVVVGHLYVARRYEETISEAEKLLAVNPNYPAAGSFLQRTYWQLGRFEESIELFRESGWGRRPENRAALYRGYAESGPHGAMLAAAQLLEGKSDSTYVEPLFIAQCYAQAGRFEPAMNWLEKAEEDRAPVIIHQLRDAAFDPLRDTQRFKALLDRLNMPP